LIKCLPHGECLVKSATIADSVDLAEMLGATMAVMWVEKYEKGRQFHVSQMGSRKTDLH
jgi:hypothetical protein